MSSTKRISWMAESIPSAARESRYSSWKSAGDGLPGFIERALEANRGVRRFPPQLAVASLTASDPTPAPAGVVSDESPAAERDAALAGILRGKPLLCIAFDCMQMDVGVPKVVPVGK